MSCLIPPAINCQHSSQCLQCTRENMRPSHFCLRQQFRAHVCVYAMLRTMLIFQWGKWDCLFYLYILCLSSWFIGWQKRHLSTDRHSCSCGEWEPAWSCFPSWISWCDLDFAELQYASKWATKWEQDYMSICTSGANTGWCTPSAVLGFAVQRMCFIHTLRCTINVSQIIIRISFSNM